MADPANTPDPIVVTDLETALAKAHSDLTAAHQAIGQLKVKLEEQTEAFEDERLDLEEEAEKARTDLRACLDAVLDDNPHVLRVMAREYAHNFDLVEGTTRLRATPCPT